MLKCVVDATPYIAGRIGAVIDELFEDLDAAPLSDDDHERLTAAIVKACYVGVDAGIDGMVRGAAKQGVTIRASR